jgi:hypothetical protein
MLLTKHLFLFLNKKAAMVDTFRFFTAKAVVLCIIWGYSSSLGFYGEEVGLQNKRRLLYVRQEKYVLVVHFRDTGDRRNPLTIVTTK